MDIKKLLFKTLSDKNILDLTADKRIYFIHANNPKPPYVEYEVISEVGDDFHEGKEIYTKYLVQVDIFSKDDYSELENIIKKVMLESGFNRDNAVDLYENKTNLYHKAMRFNISLPLVLGGI